MFAMPNYVSMFFYSKSYLTIIHRERVTNPFDSLLNCSVIWHAVDFSFYMPNYENKAASSHADGAATSANETGVFYFSFPHSTKPVKFYHPSAEFLSLKEKKQFAYEMLDEYILPTYYRNQSEIVEGALFLFEAAERKWLEEEVKHKKLQEENEAVLKRIDEQNKKILYFTTYGTFPN